ncbi:hypothetical protein ACZ90_00415 [Streptomyces albus subsp. albus]|nr:hypothetical protein ACZ90_00415 [Streptomyces albus subsp. albus]
MQENESRNPGDLTPLDLVRHAYNELQRLQEVLRDDPPRESLAEERIRGCAANIGIRLRMAESMLRDGE